MSFLSLHRQLLESLRFEPPTAGHSATDSLVSFAKASEAKIRAAGCTEIAAVPCWISFVVFGSSSDHNRAGALAYCWLFSKSLTFLSSYLFSRWYRTDQALEGIVDQGWYRDTRVRTPGAFGSKVRRLFGASLNAVPIGIIGRLLCSL